VYSRRSAIRRLSENAGFLLLESPRAGERLEFNPRIGRAGISRGEAPWLGFIKSKASSKGYREAVSFKSKLCKLKDPPLANPGILP
jgi:hypothetical protein